MAENPYAIAKRENSAQPSGNTGRKISPLDRGSRENKIKAIEKMFALLKRPKDMGDMRIMSAGFIEVVGPLPEHCVVCAVNDFIHGHVGNGWIPYPGELAAEARKHVNTFESYQGASRQEAIAQNERWNVEKPTPEELDRRKQRVAKADELFGIERGDKDSRLLPQWAKDLPPLEKDTPIAQPSPELLRKLRA